MLSLIHLSFNASVTYIVLFPNRIYNQFFYISRGSEFVWILLLEKFDEANAIRSLEEQWFKEKKKP
jgi:hypothetical protein